MSASVDANFDWRSHYKAVRARLNSAPPKPALVVIPDCPVRDTPPVLKLKRIDVANLYARPIGPTIMEPYFLWSNIGEMRAAIAEVCNRYGVTQCDLFSTRRNQKLVAMRHELMWMVKNRTTWSLPEIGRRLGGRDHTTVLHGVRKHQLKIDAEKVETTRWGLRLTAAEAQARRTVIVSAAAKRSKERKGGLIAWQLRAKKMTAEELRKAYMERRAVDRQREKYMKARARLIEAML